MILILTLVLSVAIRTMRSSLSYVMDVIWHAILTASDLTLYPLEPGTVSTVKRNVPWGRFQIHQIRLSREGEVDEQGHNREVYRVETK